ncbi:MAG: bifunctional pyr operon transcriptional regulator/uracil phosphoribosyltransferase PyrR [Acidobacteria bacterium]|nr:bifunctional pyr operon transcriptional regulator/uracil phosphoribosyltransferase PyrR [Acidobacteriota bacterium]MBI3656013.1 bifunctional pyr operon transcriptional regulator/uracil phosphoribosyltransferase PyrR [Acidobacteriota bacterium]
MKIKRQVMTGEGIDLALSRIAAEVLESHQGQLDNLAIIGIRRRGVFLGQRLAQRIEAAAKRTILTGILDITLYRDDLTTISTWPLLRETLIEFSIEGKSLILVDDVLYTGRTIRAALDGLIDMGRPRRVQLAVLVDRGHRELPIQAEYVGRFVETSDDEIVEVRLAELDNEERVVVVEQKKAGDDA